MKGEHVWLVPLLRRIIAKYLFRTHSRENVMRHTIGRVVVFDGTWKTKDVLFYVDVIAAFLQPAHDIFAPSTRN